MGRPVRSWISLAVVICMKGRPERGADTGLRLDPDAPAVGQWVVGQTSPPQQRSLRVGPVRWAGGGRGCRTDRLQVRSSILLVVAGRWQGEPERGAGTGLRLDPDAPAVVFDDLLADREADAGARVAAPRMEPSELLRCPTGARLTEGVPRLRSFVVREAVARQREHTQHPDQTGQTLRHGRATKAAAHQHDRRTEEDQAQGGRGGHPQAVHTLRSRRPPCCHASSHRTIPRSRALDDGGPSPQRAFGRDSLRPSGPCGSNALPAAPVGTETFVMRHTWPHFGAACPPGCRHPRTGAREWPRSSRNESPASREPATPDPTGSPVPATSGELGHSLGGMRARRDRETAYGAGSPHSRDAWWLPPNPVPAARLTYLSQHGTGAGNPRPFPGRRTPTVSRGEADSIGRAPSSPNPTAHLAGVRKEC